MPTVGQSDKGRRLTEYIVDAAKEQLQTEIGKNLSLYPAELLADRFINEDVDRYRVDLKKFLRDPRFFEEDEFEDANDFIREIQENKTPEYKRSCGNKLWRFYTEYLKVQPHIPEESELVLKHLVETVLREGYGGVLLVLDEMSLFMMNREETMRWEDAQTLVVLANRLAKVHNLPVWVVCSAQQAIEVRMGQKNIIADDRLKLVKLLEEDKGYYEIVLARVRSIRDKAAIKNYYLYYKRGFTWPNAIGEEEFTYFFPFHKPALEVLRAISFNLTTTRSAIAVMHQVLKHQVKCDGSELIRLWELFDEAVRYEEDPSGTYASLSAIKTQFENEYRAYESCRRQLEGLTTKGVLKTNRDKALRITQTLFLYHLSRTRQMGLTSEEIANSVLIERAPDSNSEENNEHYETISDNLKKELRQIAQSFDENNKARFRFDPVISGVNPRDEFQKARDEADKNELMIKEAWEHLLGFGEWAVKTRKMSFDLSNSFKSIFYDIAPPVGGIPSAMRKGDQSIQITWLGKEIDGLIGMRDFGKLVNDDGRLTLIESDQFLRDFAVFVGSRVADAKAISKLLTKANDPRVVVWTPASLTSEERNRLLDFAAYRKLVADWQGKETEDANTIINWVSGALQTDLGKISKIVVDCYARGRMDALNNTEMEFHVAGELKAIISPLVERVLSSVYESRDIKFDPPIIFGKEEGVKVINGLVKLGSIPKGAKPDKNISAAQNFGFGLMIMKRGADKQLDVSGNRFVDELWSFIDGHLADDRADMKVETLYKNFLGIGGPKNYGLGKRILQLYLLCLVKLGKIKLGIQSRSGLNYPTIEYSNIAEIDFNSKILDAITFVQKMAKPEHWEILRPYAEKLLNKPLQPNDIDSNISIHRGELVALFAKEREESSRLLSRTAVLLDALRVDNPYQQELDQMSKLFAADLSTGNDIDKILHALQEAFDYKAFEEEKVTPSELDDLASHIKNYENVRTFLSYETELRTLKSYCDISLGTLAELKSSREIQKKLAERLKKIQTYIDSDVRLKTELIGQIPAEASERDTLGALIREYSLVYSVLHDRVTEAAEAASQEIDSLPTEWRAKGIHSTSADYSAPAIC